MNTNGSDLGEAMRQQRALVWAAVAALIAILWLVHPFGLGLLLGVLLAFITQPLFERFSRRIGPRWAALAAVLMSGLAIGVGAGLLGWLFVTGGTALSNRLTAGEGSRELMNRALDRASGLMAKLGMSPDWLQRARPGALGPSGE
jgi:predicted PurR-regulated permease PerM